MRLTLSAAAALCLLAASCGEQNQPQNEPAVSAIDEQTDREAEPDELPPVPPELLNLPNEAFTAIEPSELDVQADVTIAGALASLLGPEMTQQGEGLNFSVRESGDEAIADIVRTNIASDAVAAGHIRIEFQRNAEGWFPVNAYRRTLCRGGADLQWTSGLCP